MCLFANTPREFRDGSPILDSQGVLSNKHKCLENAAMALPGFTNSHS